jgi:3-hydroxymyristoyl/3-hydroxydecanoyl-(acyl carrier protein) dehydratase
MLRLAELTSTSFAPDHVVAHAESGDITWSDFISDVGHMRSVFMRDGFNTYALFEHNTYRFAVALMALLATNCRVFLPGDNHTGVTTALHREGARLVGEFRAGQVCAVETGLRKTKPAELRLAGEIIVFTSGSTGYPKAIPKSLGQIDAEIHALEQTFGQTIAGCSVFGTVSHQHLYGLLFLLLAPLVSGRSFWHQPFVDPLVLADKALSHKPSYWIMSPGHLHRLGDGMPWQALRESVRLIFSSGGPLDWRSAREVAEGLGRYPMEILGSSETGAIAYRELTDKMKPWGALPCVKLDKTAAGTLMVRSPFLPNEQWFATQDAVQFVANDHFILVGRTDRIVKLEGKRISLPEIERALKASPWVEDAYTQSVQRRRETIGAVITLSDKGIYALQSRGVAAFKRELRGSLAPTLSSLALPRILRILALLPRNSQGKILSDRVATRFSQNSAPAELSIKYVTNGCSISLWVDHSCPYFEGHFPQGAVLPGVAQIKWAEDLAREYLGLHGHFSGMKKVKFKKIILPNMTVQLDLNYNQEAAQLQFNFSSASGEHSQGCLQYLATR